MASCPLCRARKPKRACPAKGAEICPHCCGTKRRSEIDCPDDCVYLGGHAPAWEGRETERRRDLKRVAPHLQGLSEDQSRLFFLALVGVVSLRAERRDVDDRLLGQALTALRKTVETRAKGLVYEHPVEDARAVGLVHSLRGLFEARDEGGRVTTPGDRDLLAVLAALEGSVKDALREEPRGASFLDAAARLVGRFAAAAPTRAQPRILEP